MNLYSHVVTFAVALLMSTHFASAQFSTWSHGISWPITPTISVSSSSCSWFIDALRHDVQFYDLSGKALNFQLDIYKKLVQEKKLGLFMFGAGSCPKYMEGVPFISWMISTFPDKLQVYSMYGRERHPKYPADNAYPVVEFDISHNIINTFGYLDQTFTVDSRIDAALYTISTQPHNYNFAGHTTIVVDPADGAGDDFEFNWGYPSAAFLINPKDCSVMAIQEGAHIDFLSGMIADRSRFN